MGCSVSGSGQVWCRPLGARTMTATTIRTPDPAPRCRRRFTAATLVWSSCTTTRTYTMTTGSQWVHTSTGGIANNVRQKIWVIHRSFLGLWFCLITYNKQCHLSVKHLVLSWRLAKFVMTSYLQIGVDSYLSNSSAPRRVLKVQSWRTLKSSFFFFL